MALKQSFNLAPDHPKVHDQRITLATFRECHGQHAIDRRVFLLTFLGVIVGNDDNKKMLADASHGLQEMARAELATVIPDDYAPSRINSDYLQKNREARHLFAAAKSLYFILSVQATEGQTELSADDKRQVEETLMQIVSPEVQPDLAIYKQALAFFVSPLKSTDEARSAFLAAVRKNMPLAFDFKDFSEIAARREAWAKEDEASVTDGDSKK